MKDTYGDGFPTGYYKLTYDGVEVRPAYPLFTHLYPVQISQDGFYYEDTTITPPTSVQLQ